MLRSKMWFGMRLLEFPVIRDEHVFDSTRSITYTKLFPPPVRFAALLSLKPMKNLSSEDEERVWLIQIKKTKKLSIERTDEQICLASHLLHRARGNVTTRQRCICSSLNENVVINLSKNSNDVKIQSIPNGISIVTSESPNLPTTSSFMTMNDKPQNNYDN